MSFNFNQLINEKYALKAFSRGFKDNNLLADLNSKIFLGMNLPNSLTFPKIKINQKSVSKIDSSLAWKLVSPLESKQNFTEPYVQKSLIDVTPSNVFFYRRTFLRKKKKVFLVYQESSKGILRQLSIRSRFLEFKKSFVKKSSLSSKLYYLKLHSKTSFIFHKPKVSCINSKIYTKFDKKLKSFNFNLNSSYMILPESKAYLAVAIKLRRIKKRFIQKQSRFYISKQIFRKKNLNLTFIKKAQLISKLTKQFVKSNSKHSQKLIAKTLSNNSSNKLLNQKIILQKYRNLNEKNKKIFKRAIKTANFETIKSDLFKIRAEQFGKSSTKSKFSERKKLKKFYQKKNKKLSSNNLFFIREVFGNFKKEFPRKSNKISNKKPKSEQRIKLNLPIKIKSSKL